MALTGSARLCSQFFQYVTKTLKLSSKTSIRKVSDNGYRVEFGGRNLPLTIIKKLYEDSSVFLDRKYDTFLFSKRYSTGKGGFND